MLKRFLYIMAALLLFIGSPAWSASYQYMDAQTVKQRCVERWFKRTHGMTLEHMDVSVMGDFRPTFHPDLEGTDALLALDDPAREIAVEVVV